MKFGLAVLPKLPLADLAVVSEAAERGGFTSLWVPDERFFRDVFVSLAAVAGSTQRVTIAPGITDPFIRHPLLTATAIASVDELSGGRAVLGLGAGVSGFDALGIVRESPARALREAIELTRAFWRGEPVTCDGTRFHVRAAQLHFPARDIPVYIAGRGPRVLALAGEVADGVIIGHFTSAPGLARAHACITEGEGRRAAGRGRPEIAVWAYTSVGSDGQAARDAVKPAIGRTVRSTPEVLDIAGVKHQALLAALDAFGYARSAAYDAAMREAVPDELTLHLSISGTPAECAARVRAIAAAGVEHIIFLPYPPARVTIPAMVQGLIGELLPLVKDL